MKRLDLSGKRFGNWTVLYRDDTNAKKYICKCNCGRTKSVWLSNLKRLSLKCRQCDEHILNRQFNDLIQSAKRRDIVVSITKEELLAILELQNYRCALTGLQITLDAKSAANTTASPDRIDSSQGYSVDNVQYVHKEVNYMKMDLHQDRFIELCRLVADRSKIYD